MAKPIFKSKPGTDEYWAELESHLKAVSDRSDDFDKIFKANKMGTDLVPVFVCSHSGLHLPSNYVKDWGVDGIGVGLGISPCSEVLDSEYHVDPPRITPDIRSIEQIMHPVGNTKAEVHLQLVNKADADYAILHRDDEYMEKRGKILRANQLKNPRGKLRLVHAAWKEAGRA